MQLTMKRLTLALASAGLMTFYGCGGGDTNSNLTTNFSGSAAVGAPIVGGSVVVTDATGTTAGTAITASDGSYAVNFETARFKAPFVVTVSGNIGEAHETLVSVQPTLTNATVNITPITHAIAALISSTNDPLDLVANIATDKTRITSDSVADVEKSFRDTLAANMTAIGLNPATDNLLNGVFTAKLDKLLDNVKVEVSASGEIKMSTSAGSAVDDLGNLAAQPNDVKVVELAKGTKPTVALIGGLLSAAKSDETPIGVDALDTLRTNLNACFALPKATRFTSSYDSKCANLVVSTYKHDGRDKSLELGTTAGLIGDSGNDGMIFQKPEILRQLSTTANKERLIVRFNAIRTDGQVRALTTVAENNPSVGPTGWQLVGNQRDYETFVNGAASKRMSVNTPANNRYESGLNFFIKQSVDIDSVVVTGPGVEQGITLKPKVGCDFLAIVNPSNNTTPSCNSFYRLSSVLFSGASYPPSSNYLYKSPSLSDAGIQGIKSHTSYKFFITTKINNTTNTFTYWNRLRSRPPTLDEITKLKTIDFTDATKALMTTGTLYNGGAIPTVGWTVPVNASRPYKVYFFHENGTDSVLVPLGKTSAAIPCISNGDCSESIYKSSLSTSGSYTFQASSRNRFDTQIFTQLTK